MPEWCFDISAAPRGSYDVIPAGKNGGASRKVFRPERIIAASACGAVCVSYWNDAAKRWSMFATGQSPIAWMPFAGPRQVVDAKGKTRHVIDFPPHPTMTESWFATFMRERKGTGTPMQRQRECLDWIAARAAA